MIREFSVIRRRPNVIDVITPKRKGVDEYTLEWAQNFDGVFAPIVTSPLHGYCDDTLRFQAHIPQSGDHVRIIFDPANYTIDDTKAFWMRFLPSSGGVPGTAGNPGLILPDQTGRGVVVIAGNAPSGASIADSLQLDFPRLIEDLRVHNLDPGATSLFVASDATDTEFELIAGATQLPFLNLRGAIPSLRVRGGGATCAFTASFTLAFAR
jgi:hypothetical protein